MQVRALTFAAVCLITGCSDDSNPSGGGSAGSTGSGGAGNGTATYACYLDATKQCTQAKAPASSVAQGKMTCDNNGGVSSDQCPATNVIGCCVNGGASCYYTGLGHDAAKLMDACAKGGGSWAATPP